MFNLHLGQIVITSDEIKTIRVWLDPLIVSLVAWMIKKWITRAQNAFHELMTDNSNRIRDEVIAYVDKKLIEHVNAEELWIRKLSEDVSSIKRNTDSRG